MEEQLLSSASSTRNGTGSCWVKNIPIEIWLYQICEFMNALDLIYSIGRVSKVWRYQIVNEHLKWKYSKQVSVKQVNLKKDENDELGEKVEEEEPINFIDNFSIEKIRYLIRDELLKFVVKYEQSLTIEGIFQKTCLKTPNTTTDQELSQNEIRLTTPSNVTSEMNSQYLNRLFENTMELFNFYFSHFTRQRPSSNFQQQTTNSVNSCYQQPTTTAVESFVEKKKIIIVGDGGVGKTTFCKSLNDPFIFDKRYLPTIGAEVHTHKLKIGNLTDTVFDLWDTAGSSKYGGLRDAYYMNCSFCIVAFDLTYRASYKSTPMWFRDIKRVEPNCEIIFVGTKNDSHAIKVLPKHIAFPFKKYCPYISISCLEQRNNRAVMWYAALIQHFVSNLKFEN